MNDNHLDYDNAIKSLRVELRVGERDKLEQEVTAYSYDSGVGSRGRGSYKAKFLDPL